MLFVSILNDQSLDLTTLTGHRILLHLSREKKIYINLLLDKGPKSHGPNFKRKQTGKKKKLEMFLSVGQTMPLVIPTSSNFYYVIFTYRVIARHFCQDISHFDYRKICDKKIPNIKHETTSHFFFLFR